MFEGWVVFICIKLNTCFQYVLNPKMDIPTTKEILLFSLKLCDIVLDFGTTYAITLFIDSFFLCVKHMLWFFKNLVCLKRENSLFWEIVHLIVVLFAAEFIICFIVCLYLFLWYWVEAPLSTIIFMIVKNVFNRNLTCVTELFNYFPLLFFIMYPQSFLSRRASDLVNPHFWALLSLTMENMCLETAFTQWEISERNNGSVIYSSSFPLDDLKT